MRQLNQTSVRKLKQWEGLRLTAYKDQAGVWTIGYGHTGPDVFEGLKITDEEAEQLLLQDLQEAQLAVERYVKVALTDNQYGALVSFVFNVGVTAFRTSALLRKLNAGNYDAVPAELLRWNKITVKGRKVVNRGLANRRAAEIGLWSTGEPAPSTTMDEKAHPQKNTLARNPGVQGGAIGITGVVGEQMTDTANTFAIFADYSAYIRIAFFVMMVAGAGLIMYATIKQARE